jgi:NRPS condensation-like uncharacterized protein
MKQLTGIDAGFLYMETPTTFGHINGLSIYERPRAKGFKPYDVFRAQIESRLGALEPFRRRLVEVPLGLDHPWWIDDPAFDLDFHLRHIAVPPPGGDSELADLVARIIGRPLDRSRPLWEAYVIEGLKNRRWAVLLKLHHATVDGAAGAELLTMLLDREPTEPTGTSAQPSAGTADATEAKGGSHSSGAVPTPAEMLSRTALNLAMRPERMARAQLRVWREAGEILSGRGSDLLGALFRPLTWPGADGLGSAPATGDANDAPAGGAAPTFTPQVRVAPPTPFNRAITPHRRFAFRTRSLAEVKRIKTHFGATVNDVVMAACAGGLRRYLARHDMLSDQPLLAAVPVSIRTGEEAERWTNRVSSIVAALPTHLDDPLERLAATHQAMVEAKVMFDLVPADALQDYANYSPPALFAQASALLTRTRIADRVNSPVNLVISNVPGPREPLYLGPAKLAHYIPVSTIAEGVGLNITVQSYEDNLDFGLVGCRELMPDIWDLLDEICDELDLLSSYVEG